MSITMKIFDTARGRGLLHKEAFDKARGAVYVCKQLIDRGTIKPDDIKLGSTEGTEE